jgi:hypothetical protein
LALTGVPADISANATSPSGAVVTYAAPAAVDEAGDSPAASAGCAPASGSTFPVGTTTVTCTATSADDTPSSVSQTFTVTVAQNVDLTIALSVGPPSATNGTVVAANFSLTNTSNVSRTVTLGGTVSFIGSSGHSFTLKLPNTTLQIGAGQTISRTLRFIVTAFIPRGTYSFTATARDTTGSVSSAATFNVT